MKNNQLNRIMTEGHLPDNTTDGYVTVGKKMEFKEDKIPPENRKQHDYSSHSSSRITHKA